MKHELKDLVCILENHKKKKRAERERVYGEILQFRIFAGKIVGFADCRRVWPSGGYVRWILVSRFVLMSVQAIGHWYEHCDAMSDKTTKCPICYEVFDRLQSLHFHCVQNHPKKFICCPICYQLFRTLNDFVEHSNSHHGRLTKGNVLVDIEIRQPDYRKPYNSIWCVCS